MEFGTSCLSHSKKNVQNLYKLTCFPYAKFIQAKFTLVPNSGGKGGKT